MFRRKPQSKPLPFEPYRPPQPVTVDHEPQLHPAQRQTIDWSEPDSRPLPVKAMSYVPAASDLMRTPNVTIASPDAHLDANIIPASMVEARVVGSHRDRADAWLRYSLPLSVSMGVVTTIAAVALYNVPLLSWSAMITFGLTFVGAYAALLMRYWQTSPEGVALYHTQQLWRLFHKQQDHRHAIEREEYRRDRRGR